MKLVSLGDLKSSKYESRKYFQLDLDKFLLILFQK